MGNEAAVIVPIPEVEPVVGALRLQYDPAPRLGVPAHITLLYPFCRPQVVAHEINTLANVCESIAVFQFSFTEVRQFPATAYLHPDKAEAFAQITRTLMNIWPECRPYGGAFPDIVPHLTVADRVSAEILSTVEELLRGQVPIACVAREIWLITSDHAGTWSKEASFALPVFNKA
jgi:2'-5' RNA ligase